MIQRLALLTTLLLFSSRQHAGSQATDGEPSAADLYHKMADAFLKAKTVQLSCKANFKTAGFTADVTAFLVTKEGNRMRLEVDIKGSKDGEPYSHNMRMVSDGSRIRTRDNQEPWTTYATTAHWNEVLLLNIIRGGFPTGLELDRIKSKEGKSKDDVGIAFNPIPEPEGFVLWKAEEVKQRKVLPIEFKIKSAAEYLKESSVILWLDPRTGLPVKRLNVVQTNRTLTVSETYESVLLDGAVDDSRFSLPQE